MDHLTRDYLDTFLAKFVAAKTEMVQAIQARVRLGQMTAQEGQQYLDMHQIPGKADQPASRPGRRADEILPG